MFYDRQVKYFDYLVKGERCGNAGFVKLEVRDKACNIHINIYEPERLDSHVVKAYIATSHKESELCELELQKGRSVKQLLQLSAENLGGSGIAYGELKLIRIVLSPERELRVVLEKKEVKATVINMTENLHSERIQEDLRQEVVSAEQQVEIIQIEAFQEEAEQTEEKKEKQDAFKVGEDKKMPLHDEKWRQLWEIYPRVCPFRDEREYLSVGPGDFVVLPEKYYRVVNNSFLLHGYYNYKHLVLKKAEVRGENRYYIGVPGNFYDREKQVAVMFGFESFESLGETAEMGEFGYYLMRIEL